MTVDVSAAQSAERAGFLLTHVIDADSPVSVSAAALACGIPKSTASRLLAALERNGLLQREVDRGPYSPGAVLVAFAARRDGGRDLATIAAPSLDRLASVSSETINLSTAGTDSVLTLAQIETPHLVGVGSWLDRRVIPFHASAVGKLFLAFGAASLPDGPLAVHGPRTITDRRALEAALVEIRGSSLSIAIDELESGLAAVAAPIRGVNGAVAGALSISGPTFRLSAERIAHLVPVLTEEAASVSHHLGYRQPLGGTR